MATKELSNENIDQETGEVMAVIEDNQPLAVQLAQAEMNQAITTARAFPRSVSRAVSMIVSLATLDEESAAECVYALPRGGKPILGPSVRFAEIVATQWGNCDTASRVVDIDRFNKVVIAEGVFHDLETGYRRVVRVSRRIQDRSGRILNDDMITVTGNAAAAIAYRNAVLTSIAKGVWRKGYNAAMGAKNGDIKTLATWRTDVIAAFAVWGVKPEQIFAALEIGGLDDIDFERIALLKAMRKQIIDKEQTVEDFFPAKTSEADRTTAARGTAAKLKDIAEGGQTGATGGTAATAEATAAKEATKPAGEATAAGAEAKEAKPKKTEAPKAEADAGKTVVTFESGVTEESIDLLGGDAKPQISDDDLEAAFKRGAAARDKGMARKAIPPEWRDPANETVLAAYLRGFDGE